MEYCKICGELLSFLTTVHCEKHGITKEEYRLKYGTPDKKKRITFGTFRKTEHYTEADKYLMGRGRRNQL